MIIQTGMRTDIPAFYSKWFINRIDEGFVLVRNPYNPEQVTRYSLSPDVVDLIAFCTKNPAPMLLHMDKLRPYGQYWFVTITPYGKDIEPNVPDKKLVMEDFKRLSSILGPECMGWRYDPIFIDNYHTVEWHINQFDAMAQNLRGYTSSCVISFIDIYKKVERNFTGIREVTSYQKNIIGEAFARICKTNGMILRPCAEGNELEKYGADCSGCMTVGIYEAALHSKLLVPQKKLNQRRGECACYLGIDIGVYDTCNHLCKYCYANSDISLVKENIKKHNPDSPFLIGDIMPDDIIHIASQKSFINKQLSLFD